MTTPTPTAQDGERERMGRAYVQHYGGARMQNWQTPREFFDRLNAEFSFTLDGATEHGNSLLPRGSTMGEPIAWGCERVFCNPPWSNIAPFVELAAEAELAVLLVPARTNCRWFHRALELGATPRFFKGRLKFGEAQWNSPVDCLLLVFGDAQSAELAALRA
jgi:hypothetical protein